MVQHILFIQMLRKNQLHLYVLNLVSRKNTKNTERSKWRYNVHLEVHIICSDSWENINYCQPGTSMCSKIAINSHEQTRYKIFIICCAICLWTVKNIYIKCLQLCKKRQDFVLVSVQFFKFGNVFQFVLIKNY